MSLDEDTGSSSNELKEPASRALRGVLTDLAGPMIVIGGLLWVTTYVVQILIGVVLGEATYASPDLSDSWLVWLWPATFVSATLCLAVGLLGVAAQIGHRGRVLAVLGGLAALVALAASAINLIRLTGVVGEVTASDDLGFAGVVGVLAGSVLLGVATTRGKDFERRLRLTLALMPLAFVPAIIATIPLEAVAPQYVAADLPFAVVGLVFAMVGAMLHRGRG